VNCTYNKIHGATIKIGYKHLLEIFLPEKFNDYTVTLIFKKVSFHFETYVKINENKCK